MNLNKSKNNIDNKLKTNKESNIYLYLKRIINKCNLFWQYPVITEKIVNEQQKHNENYLGLPWATIIDKKLNLYGLYFILNTNLEKGKEYITTCQHIFFKKLIPFFKKINIKILYVAHKIKGEDVIDGIEIRACPLYAVNVEDVARNKEFKDLKNEDYLNRKRKYLYSFVGGYQNAYLSKIRINIFNLKKSDNTFIQNTGSWHFNNIVYKKQVCNIDLNNKDNQDDKNKTKNYNNILLDSRFSLCPSGSGPNTIRFWESLAVGAIPVLLSDTLELPKHKLWKDAIISIKEKEIFNIDNILSNITEEKEKLLRENCLKIYYYFKNNFIDI